MKMAGSNPGHFLLALSSPLPATNAKQLCKGAIATKQSMPQQAEKWIASLRSQ
jgi:hypothetical protein